MSKRRQCRRGPKSLRADRARLPGGSLRARKESLYIGRVGTPSDSSPVAARLLAALDLHEVGVDLMRQNLRRRHPRSSDEDIDARLKAWLLTRPGAEAGDCPGRAVDLATRRT